MFLEKFPYRVKFYTKGGRDRDRDWGLGIGESGLGIGDSFFPFRKPVNHVS